MPDKPALDTNTLLIGLLIETLMAASRFCEGMARWVGDAAENAAEIWRARSREHH